MKAQGLSSRRDVQGRFLAPFVDELRGYSVSIFRRQGLVAQSIQAAREDVWVVQFPEQVDLVQKGAGRLEGQHRPVTARVEQAQLLEVA